MEFSLFTFVKISFRLLVFLSVISVTSSCGSGGGNDSDDDSTGTQNSAPVASGTSASFDTSQQIGSVITSIVASDADGDNLNYSITSGNNLGHFSIDANSGDISLVTSPDEGNYVLGVDISDGAATTSVNATIGVTASTTTPTINRPEDVATVIDTRVIEPFANGISFLYEGEDALQFGFVDGSLETEQVSVLRGSVRDGAESPAPALQNVRVEVLDHPEYGYTMTRDDGQFDIAVNGGGDVILVFSADGYLKAQRRVMSTPWNDFVLVPDLALVPLDTVVTQVQFGASTTEFQTARATEISDSNGTRTPTLLVPPGTTASLELPGGAVEQTQLDLRMTEYTVGDDGPMRMVADLPPASAYTHAVEISADQALAQNASSVNFNQPVYYYLDNYRGFPVGGIVPSGYYDLELASWVASENGLVIGIVGVSAGMVDVDIDGDGVADTNLTSINMSTQERTQLATLYEAGTELFRVPTHHLTAYDHNWSTVLPFGADSPDTAPEFDESDPCSAFGSVINCPRQTLGEHIALPGTGMNLVYNSHYVTGYGAGRSVSVPVSGPNQPGLIPNLVRFTVTVAGQRVVDGEEILYDPDVVMRGVWNGEDAYGRPVQGSRLAFVDLAYEYTTYYSTPSASGQSFGQSGGAALPVPGPEGELFSYWELYLENFQAKEAAVGLGGWTLDTHHTYDISAATVYLGDGGTLEPSQPIINTLPLGQTASGLDVYTFEMDSVVTAADGSIFFDTDTYIYKRSPDGTFEIIAGNGLQETNCNGCRAQSAGMRPGNLSYAPDGSIYFVDHNSASYLPTTLRRLYPNNGEYYVEHIATKDFVRSGDGGLAVDATFTEFADFEVGPDSALHIVDDDRVRRISTDGYVTTIVGGGSETVSDGMLAIDADIREVLSIDFDDNGVLYILFEGTTNPVIYKMLQDGTLSHVAGIDGSAAFVSIEEGVSASDVSLMGYDKIRIAADGSIYLTGTGGSVSNSTSRYNMDTVRQISPEGFITTYAGSYTKFENDGDGEAAFGAGLNNPGKVALLPSGDRLLIPSTRDIRVVEESSAIIGSDDEYYHVTSNSKPEVYVFDQTGRHQLTRHSLTGGVLYRFEYDSSGLLSQVIAGNGETVTIHRDSALSVRVVSAGGYQSQLTMNGDGYLDTLQLPGTEQYNFTYASGGLLQTASFPDGVTSTFEYDTLGRLLRDSNTQGLDVRLARTNLTNGFEVTKSYYDTVGLTKQETYRTENQGAQMVSTYQASTGGSNVTTFAPDGSVSVQYPDGSQTTMRYAADPRWGMMAPNLSLMRVEQPSGLTREIARSVTVDVNPDDIFGLNSQVITSTINGTLSSTETYTRQLMGLDNLHQIAYASPMGRTETFTIDELGRNLRIQRPGVDDTLYNYNTEGQLASTSFGGESYAYDYDPITRLLESSTDVDGQSISYDYDANGFTNSIEQPSGLSVDMQRDAEGRLTQVVPAKGNDYSHQLSWRRDGKLDSYSPPAGVLTQLNYTADGRHSGSDVEASDPLTRTYQYNASYKLSSVDDDLGSATFSYTGFTELYDVTSYQQLDTDGLDQTTNFDYDGNLLTQMTIDNTGSSSDIVQVDYDSLFRATEIRFNPGSVNLVTSIGWSDDSLVTGYGDFTFTRSASTALVETLSDGVADFNQIHNSRAHLETRSLEIGSVDVINLSLGYAVSGKLSSSTVSVGTASNPRHYAYDLGRQLETVKVSAAAVTNLEHYSYDDNGNVVAYSYNDGSVQTVAMTFNERDQLVARDGIAYSYDDRGNLLGRGSDSFVYDTHGRLLSATIGVSTIRYGYDARGRRTSRTDATGTTEYFYAIPGNDVLVTHIREADGTLVVLYYDREARLIAFDRVSSGNDRFYVLSDLVGTPLVITDASGIPIIQREYSAYGIRFNETNTAGFDSPLGFAGGLEDPVTGLVRFGMRDFEPASVHWTARDPILFDGKQSNIYAYSTNDPVNYRDLSGLLCVGASAYDIVGGGAEFCYDEEGFSLCGKAGIGIGGGVSFSPAGSPASTGGSLNYSFGGNAGPVNANLNVEVGPEGVSCTIGVDFGTDFGIGAGGELAAKYCVGS